MTNVSENYTYILECADGSLYCGWTNDLEKRLEAHNAGIGGKYTRSRRPVKLIYHETFATKQESMQREYRIKRLSRQKKLELIEKGRERVTDMKVDCCFTKENQWFRYRVGAIIVEDGCVLVVGNEKENYFYSVGGGVHMNEKAEDAVIREVLEETGARYQIDRLAIIHENFWNGNGAYDKGLHCHEIALYYLMKPRGTKELNSNSLTHFNDRETMHWIPINEIENYTIYPTFLKEYLLTEHVGIEHIVTDERT